MRETGLEPWIFSTGDSLLCCIGVIDELTKIPAGHDGKVGSFIGRTLDFLREGVQTT